LANKACRPAARPPRKSLQIGRPAAKKKPAGLAGKACRPGPHLKAAAKGGPAWPLRNTASAAPSGTFNLKRKTTPPGPSHNQKRLRANTQGEATAQIYSTSVDDVN